MSLEDRLCFITLLCLASNSEDGVIKNCDEASIIRLTNLPYDQFKKDNSFARAKGFLQRLNDNAMITRSAKNDIKVKNFMKRQDENLSNYERVKKHREKRKMALLSDIDIVIDDNKDNVSNVINVTQNDNNDNAYKNRIDKNRLEKKNTILAGASPAPFNIEEKLQKMEKIPNSYLDIIASFIREKPVRVENSKQLSAVISRFARVSQKLSGAYTNEQIFGAAEKIKKDNKRRENRGDDIDWTLETVFKTLTK
jgi:hypothetical protein